MRYPVQAGGIFARFCNDFSATVRRILVVVLFFVTTGLYAQAPLQDREQLYEKQIMESAREHGVDPMLIKAVIFTESSFFPDKTGKDGEIGLMQIRQAAARDWANAKGVMPPEKEAMFDPGLNIEIGTWYLARALKHWYDNPDFLRMALAEYNAGRTRLLQWMKICNQNTDLLFQSKPVGKYADKVCRKYVEYTIGNIEKIPEIKKTVAKKE